MQVSAKGSRDDLEGRLIAFHNDFIGVRESQMSQDATISLALAQAMPSFNDPTGATRDVQDPLLKSDAWKAFVRTPMKSQRDHDVHTGGYHNYSESSRK